MLGNPLVRFCEGRGRNLLVGYTLQPEEHPVYSTTFPTMSLSELSFNSSLKGLQGGINRTNHRIPQVRKAGLAPQRGCPAGGPALPRLLG